MFFRSFRLSRPFPLFQDGIEGVPVEDLPEGIRFHGLPEGLLDHALNLATKPMLGVTLDL